VKKDSIYKDAQTAEQVKKILAAVKKSSSGNAVELRIPLYGAIQCVAGVNHRRGNPANQVEMRAEVLIQLSEDPSLWHQLVNSGQIQATGQLSDLSQVFSTTFEKIPRVGG
jgi:hypothetical protein